MSFSSLTPDLRNAMQGQYTLDVRNIFQQAWKKLYGFKASFWMALLLSFFLLFSIFITGYAFVSLLIASSYLLTNHIGLSILLPSFFIFKVTDFLTSIVEALLFISLVHLTLQWCRNQSIKLKNIFAFRYHWKPLTALIIIFSLIIFLLMSGYHLGSSLFLYFLTFSVNHTGNFLGFFFLLSFSLFFLSLFLLSYWYCLALFSFAALLIVDKRTPNLKISLIVAFKSLNAQLFNHLCLFLLAILLFAVGAIFTVGISIVWLLPWFFLVFVLQYQAVFGEKHDESLAEKKNRLASEKKV